MDLSLAAGASDEKQDLENLAAAGHGEDLRHPCSNPLEMFRRLNDPYKCKATSGDSAICVTGNNVAHVWNLVSDTNTSSPEHDRAVGAEIFAAYFIALAWVDMD